MNLIAMVSLLFLQRCLSLTPTLGAPPGIPSFIAGLQLSQVDDLQNDQPIYKWFEREFFSAVQSAEPFNIMGYIIG